MAPRPLTSDNLRTLDRGLEKIISFFKSIPDYIPLSNTYPHGVESGGLMDRPVPAILPAPLTPSLLPVPTGFELKSPGPENVPWEKVPTLKKSNEYLELTENPWAYKDKRSSTYPFLSTAEVPIMLTHKIVQDQEPLVMGQDGSGAGPLARQQLGGGYCLTCCQELSLFIFIILAIVSMGSAVLWAAKKAGRKKPSRHVDRCLAEPGADEKVQQTLFIETTLKFP